MDRVDQEQKLSKGDVKSKVVYIQRTKFEIQYESRWPPRRKAGYGAHTVITRYRGRIETQRMTLIPVTRESGFARKSLDVYARCHRNSMKR